MYNLKDYKAELTASSKSNGNVDIGVATWSRPGRVDGRSGLTRVPVGRCGVPVGRA